jgi:hypothetical protein
MPKTRQMTPDGTTPEGTVFIEKLDAILPQRMSGGELIAAMGTLLTQYTDGPHHAKHALVYLAEKVLDYYNDVGVECDCPNCTEWRKKAAH